MFTDEDFEASLIHHEPSTTSQQASSLPENSVTVSLRSTSSNDNASIMICTPEKPHIVVQCGSKCGVAPEDVRPYPKTTVQSKKTGGRKKRKSAILTETPEKNRIEEETLKRLEKKRIKLIPKATRPKQQHKLLKKLSFNNSSESECEDHVSLHDESDEDLGRLIASTNSEYDFERGLSDDLVLKPNDYVLVEFDGKKKVLMLVGQTEEVEEEEGRTYKVKFMRKKDSWKFYFPEKEDISSVEREDIKMKLPQPNLSGGTARAVSAMVFFVDFSSIQQRIM